MDEITLGDHWVERRTYFEDGYMLIERRDSIALARGVRRVGISKTGKLWSKWNNRSWTFFSMKPRADGSQHLRVYTRDKKSGGRGSVMADVTSSRHSPAGIELPELWTAVYAMADRAQKPVVEAIRQLEIIHRIPAIAYPYLALTVNPDAGLLTRKPTPGLAKAMRQTNHHDFVTAAFGQKYVRKDLVRATGTASMRIVSVAVALRRTVPIDWIVEMINVDNSSQAPESGWYDQDVAPRDIVGLLNLLPLHARRRLMLEPGFLRMRDVRDAANDLRRLATRHGTDLTWITPEVTGARTWRALHDALTIRERRVVQASEPIEQDLTYEAVDGLIVGPNLTVVSAKSTGDLFKWGGLMSNCINGYRNDALRHTAYLYGLFDGQKLIANIEIAPSGIVRQLLGRFNEDLPEDIDAEVRAALSLAHQRSLEPELRIAA